MSAIGGVFARSGRTCPEHGLQSLADAMEAIGPDGITLKRASCIEMVFRPFWTSATTHVPDEGLFVDVNGFIVAFDGRIYNAQEAVEGSGLSRNAASAAALTVAVYRRHGVRGLATLIGDFALALWDPIERHTVLCCDAMGRRPLYYTVERDYVWWASSCRSLLRVTTRSQKIDDSFVASFVANEPSEHSPFAGIDQVQGGTAVIVSDTGVKRERVWSFDDVREIDHASDDAYEAHFADVFRLAVSCRCEDAEVVFAELSGGVDSSSVACAAAAALGRRQTGKLHTVSWVYDLSKSSDETEFIAVVERAIGAAGLHVRESAHPPLSRRIADCRPDVPAGSLCFVAATDCVVREMQRRNARVLLSGMGGDQVFWSQPDIRLLLEDLVVGRRWRELFRQTKAWSQFLETSISTTLVAACRPIHPAFLARRLANVADHSCAERQVAPWFKPEFVARHGLDRLLENETRPARNDASTRLPSQRAQAQSIRRAMRLFALEPFSTQGYVERRYPFLDRRVVEFSLGIPMDQKVRVGESRSIVRRGLRGVVPDTILQRRTKAGPDEAFHRALSTHWPELTDILSDPLVAAYGFVERHAFQTALTRARHGIVTDRSQLIKTVGLELWLRTLDVPRLEGERGSRAARSAALST